MCLPVRLIITTVWYLCHWVQSKRHRLWFSTKTCSCNSTKTHINSMIHILKLNLTSLSTTHILMFLNEVKFRMRMRITLFTWVFVEKQIHDFVENHSLWRFDCTQCMCRNFSVSASFNAIIFGFSLIGTNSNVSIFVFV